MEKDCLKMKLCVSGAAEASHCGVDAMELSKEIGKEIARSEAVLMNGATTGFPLWAAMGAKEVNGFCIGLSPASNEKEHREVYKLPTEYLDLIIYTGFGYPGRDLLLTRSSDAIFIGCGRIGTIHEFTIAYEDNKPVGILEGPWKTDEILKEIMRRSNRVNEKVIFDQDPKRLVERIVAMVKKDKQLYAQNVC